MTDHEPAPPNLPDRVEIAPNILVDQFMPGAECFYAIGVDQRGAPEIVVVSNEELNQQIELDEAIYGQDLPPRTESIRHRALTFQSEKERLECLIREQRNFAIEWDVDPESVTVLEFNKERAIRFAKMLGVKPE